MVENINAVKVQDLNFYYREKQALKNINLDISQNMVTALIGPSGCGKSTFLRLLNRMNDMISGTKITGRVLLNGVDIYNENVDPVDIRRRVGMVFQKPNPFPKTIFNNVAYGPMIHGKKNKKSLAYLVEKALVDAALWDEVKDDLHKSALALSGGQQQRLCIARALAMQPEILLMDEPTSALDPISTSKIEELVTAELKKKYTVIIVTHNMQQAARISDQTCFFLLGELVESGDTHQIFTLPKDKRTESYITGRFG